MSFLSCTAYIFRLLDNAFQRIKALKDWKRSISSYLGRKLLLELLDQTTSNRRPGEFLSEEKKKAIKEFSKVSPEKIVECTENLSYKTLVELRACPPLKSILPCPTTLVKYRDQCSDAIYSLFPQETSDGCYLNSFAWIQKMLEEFINNHDILKDNPPTSIEVAWTVDYAKCGWTFSGFQILGYNINQNSSSNYCVNNIFFAIDNHASIKENCADSLNFLNSSIIPILINVSGVFRYINVIRTVLNDISAHEAILKKKEICFFCDCGSENPKCKYTHFTLHGVTLKWYTPYNLFDYTSYHHPESLVHSLPLWHLKLDWGFHGHKRFMNNYLKAVYDRWLASKATKNPKVLAIEEAIFDSKMRRLVNPKYNGIIIIIIIIIIIQFL